MACVTRSRPRSSSERPLRVDSRAAGADETDDDAPVVRPLAASGRQEFCRFPRFEKLGTKLASNEENEESESEKSFDFFGATRRIRTDDLLITNSHVQRNSSTQQHKPARKTGNSKG
jgi:hypothetical protein